jgi:N-acyl-D-aspartate/D-glutamate deacylase
MAWSLLIRNGTVVDGSGAPRAPPTWRWRATASRRSSRGSPGGRAGHRREGPDGGTGFIDAHSHSDLVYDKCPSAESKVRQGVTTEVVGMCSFSPAPVAPGRAGLVQEWAGGIGARFRSRGTPSAVPRSPARARAHRQHRAVRGHGALRFAAVGPTRGR